MERVDEMQTPPVVGQTYLVPCILVEDVYLPVMGPRHEDLEHIGFGKEHFHYDPRFLTEVRLRSIARTPLELFTGIIFAGPAAVPLELVLAEVLVTVITNECRVAHEPLVCLREMPAYPVRAITWLGSMEPAFAEHTLKTCRVCPHRGVPLGSLPVGADGTVVCPGHGLRWDVATGRLVRSGT